MASVHLKGHPDAPLYITEGEKKAAKAWLEGIPCIGIQGIYNWLANKDDRPNGEKTLHPDFGLIPDLDRRAVFMVYDSDALDPEKKNAFDKCSADLAACLRARGVARYEKIILPSISGKKTGLDDFLMAHEEGPVSPTQALERVVAEQSTTIPLGSYIMTSQRFLKANFPPIYSIIQPWLPDCGLTMVHARAGVGKTYFLLAMAAAITREKLPEDFCGWKIRRGTGVLYVDGEIPSFSMQQRLAQVLAAHPDNPESKVNRLYLMSCMYYTRETGKAYKFTDENTRGEFLRKMREHPARIIILDNIVSLMMTKDENDAGAWSEINQWLLQLRGIGKSVIIVHHSSKRDSQRGTSHREDNLDTIIRLSRSEDKIAVLFEKSRNFGGADAKPVYLDFRVDNDRALFTRAEHKDEQMVERNEEIRRMIAADEPYDKIVKQFGISKGRISQIKKEMEEGEAADE